MLRPLFALFVGALFTLPALAQSPTVPTVRNVRSSPPQAVPQRSGNSHRPDRLLQSGHTKSIQALAFSADGRWLASGGYDKTVIVWNVTTGEERWKLAGYSDTITTLAFDPGATRLISTTANGQVKVWDLQAGTAVYSVNMRAAVRGAGFSPDGKFWAIGAGASKLDTQMKIEIHDAASGTLVRTVPTPWGSVNALTMTPEGMLVASGETGEDDEEQGSVQVWKVASGELVKNYPVIATAFSANGRFMGRIDYSKDPKSIVVYEVTTGQQLRTFPAGNPGAVFLSADGQAIAVTDPMRTELKVWSIATGSELKTMPGEPTIGGTGLNTAAFSGDGKTIVAAPYAGNSIKAWGVATGRELLKFEGQSPVQGMAVTPDGRWLLVGSPLGLNAWDVAAGKKLVNLANGPVDFLVVSGDGRWLAANPGVRFPGETLRVWGLKTGATAADFNFGNGGTPVRAMAFVLPQSPLTSLGPVSRSWEFTGDDGKHAIWSGPSPVASSPDGKLLVAQFGMGGDLNVWDVTSGQRLTTVAAHKMSISSMSFSHDGRLLVTTGQETPSAGNFATTNQGNQWGMKVWDVATWKPRLSISFVRSGAPCAAISPDGRMAAVERSWEVVELLDIASGGSLGELTATDPQPQYHQFNAKNLTFSTDGKLLFEGGQNGVRVWKVTK